MNDNTKIIAVHIPDDEYNLVEQWIDCDMAKNPMPEEYLFYNPTRTFEWRLRLMGYAVGGSLDK